MSGLTKIPQFRQDPAAVPAGRRFPPPRRRAMRCRVAASLLPSPQGMSRRTPSPHHAPRSEKKHPLCRSCNQIRVRRPHPRPNCLQHSQPRSCQGSLNLIVRQSLTPSRLSPSMYMNLSPRQNRKKKEFLPVPRFLRAGSMRWALHPPCR